MGMSMLVAQLIICLFEFCSLGDKPQVLSLGYRVVRWQVQASRVQGPLYLLDTGLKWSFGVACRKGDSRTCWAGAAGPVWSPEGVTGSRLGAASPSWLML
jgi:hypothetical protein